MSFEAVSAMLVQAVRDTLREEMEREPTDEEVLVVMKAMGLPAEPAGEMAEGRMADGR